jgi:predicted nucleotidyltransferase
MKAAEYAAEEIARVLKKRLDKEPDVIAAYLFGSVARATAGPLSDVDVAVLLRPYEYEDGLRRRLEIMGR